MSLFRDDNLEEILFQAVDYPAPSPTDLEALSGIAADVHVHDPYSLSGGPGPHTKQWIQVETLRKRTSQLGTVRQPPILMCYHLWQTIETYSSFTICHAFSANNITKFFAISYSLSLSLALVHFLLYLSSNATRRTADTKRL